MALLIFPSLIRLEFTSLINFPFALEIDFQIPHRGELDILGITIGLELLF
jgi:hypothetical protein